MISTSAVLAYDAMGALWSNNKGANSRSSPDGGSCATELARRFVAPPCGRASNYFSAPLIVWRCSSLYEDGDGDVAHAFYEQRDAASEGRNRVHSRATRTVMCPVSSHQLKAVVREPYPVPRLDFNSPVVIYDLSS